MEYDWKKPEDEMPEHGGGFDAVSRQVLVAFTANGSRVLYALGHTDYGEWDITDEYNQAKGNYTILAWTYFPEYQPQ